MLKLLLISGLLFGGALVAAEPPKVNDSGPSQLIGSVAEAMLQALDTNRAEYRQDPAKIDDLVGQIMLPHFDTQYAARLVLGRHWTTASAEQRKRFVDAFYHSLLRNYGSALVDFTPDRLKVCPTRAVPTRPARRCARRFARTTARWSRSTTACAAQPRAGRPGTW